MSEPRIERALLDDEQGVDDLGHECVLALLPLHTERGQYRRVCRVVHADYGARYEGMPLGREGLTTHDLDVARDHGADSYLIGWLRSEVLDRMVQCDDCGREYEGPVYYSFPTDACVSTRDEVQEGERRPLMGVDPDDLIPHGTDCTGALCPDCAGPYLEPDHENDHRRPTA